MDFVFGVWDGREVPLIERLAILIVVFWLLQGGGSRFGQWNGKGKGASL